MQASEPESIAAKRPFAAPLRLALQIPLLVLASALLLSLAPFPASLKPALGWLYTLPLLAEAIAVPIAVIHLRRAPYARAADKALTIVAAIPLALALLF